ncbi:MAG: enoyl-CoA hydratase/isomerase family protein [Ilumatobacter sp.]|uniref:enoyl-CoA hydratase/isomerase family protein n=1 Tax=Ilumatobacter sp. TaxID=1967498 RepID=UPI00262D3B47|nr:enoyl-CoA hydratase/isomerase family protein [Ilumatobacter sp.]MDJ0769193.1 enoyl-CoA hydratase/isomerase family protein [Ilumatobacter sp.]
MATATTTHGDVEVTIGDDRVATAEIRRPPNNFFDLSLIESLAGAFAALDDDERCRAIVLCSEGRHFCAGADFGSGGSTPEGSTRHLYDAAYDLFATKTPVVAAVQGAAIGGGLGLACMPDFRVAAPEARFSANFARLGFHHGFALTVTLPRLVGQQRALELLYTGRRITGEEAAAIGLVDQLVTAERLRDAARQLAVEIATSAPLAVRSIRETMRGDLPELVAQATDREKAEQDRLRRTDDWREGVAAMAERRTPKFTGS